MKYFKIITLGCKVNQYESQCIYERMLSKGFAPVERGQTAQICIINTCTVTHSADSKSTNAIRKMIRENPQAMIIVTGCLAKLDRNILAAIKRIDYIIDKSFFPSGISGFAGRTRAFIKIQDGCKRGCSYCRVPLARPFLSSRPLESILSEAERLAGNGYREIVFTGICIGNYRVKNCGRESLSVLVRETAGIKGIERIRISSIEPVDIDDSLIMAMSQEHKFCPHLHIPLQSGDDTILKAMNRRYTFLQYSALVARIRKIVPAVSITTDIMVGFPGEDEKAFKNTLKAIAQINPLKVHIFPYSPRPGTRAALLAHSGQAVIRERLQRINQASSKSMQSCLKVYLGKDVTVLVEKKIKDTSGVWWEGYSDSYAKVRFKSEGSLCNTMAVVQINATGQDELRGNCKHLFDISPKKC